MRWRITVLGSHESQPKPKFSNFQHITTTVAVNFFAFPIIKQNGTSSIFENSSVHFILYQPNSLFDSFMNGLVMDALMKTFSPEIFANLDFVLDNSSSSQRFRPRIHIAQWHHHPPPRRLQSPHPSRRRKPRSHRRRQKQTSTLRRLRQSWPPGSPPNSFPLEQKKLTIDVR